MIRIKSHLAFILIGWLVAASGLPVAAAHQRPPPISRWTRYMKNQGYHHRLAHFVIASEALARVSEATVDLDLVRTKSSVRKRQTLKEKIPALILVVFNTVIFLAWQLDAVLETQGIGNWMIQHFTHNPSFSAELPHTILTSAFSHASPRHIWGNMIALWMFTPQVVRLLGYRGFAYFYVGSAYASKALDQVLFSRHNRRTSLGASGAISAVQILHCLSFPSNKFKIDDFAVSAPRAALIWAAEEMWLLNSDDGVGHGAHLGGYLFGALVFGWRYVEKHGAHKVCQNVLDWLFYNLEKVLDSSVEKQL